MRIKRLRGRLDVPQVSRRAKPVRIGARPRGGEDSQTRGTTSPLAILRPRSGALKQRKTTF